MGVLDNFFLTGTYTGIGTTCVESEKCYEKYHEKKSSYQFGISDSTKQLMRRRNKTRQSINPKIDLFLNCKILH